jgi:hypothetical protein
MDGLVEVRESKLKKLQVLLSASTVLYCGECELGSCACH